MPVDSKKIHTTPKGIAVFPKLTEPDTKFNKEGMYSVRVKFEKEDEGTLILGLMALADQAYADHCKEKKKPATGKTALKRSDFPWKSEIEKVYDSEGMVIEENETGFILFNFKLKAQFKSRTGKIITMKPRLYDAKGKYLGTQAGLDIGGGSVIKVAYTVRPFCADALGSGISLQLQGAQIIELVSYGEKSAKEMGFDEEDGYSGEEFGGGGSGEPSKDDSPDPTSADF